MSIDGGNMYPKSILQTIIITIIGCFAASTLHARTTIITSLPYTANQMGRNYSETLLVAGTNLASATNGVNITGHDIVLNLGKDTLTFGTDGSEHVYGVNFGSALTSYNIMIIGGWLIHGIKNDTLSNGAACVKFQYPTHDILIRRTSMIVSGDNGRCIDYQAEARSSYNIEISGGHYWSHCRRYTSREHYDGAVIRATFTGEKGSYNLKIHGIRIWTGPGQGIVAAGTWGSDPPNCRAIVYACTISVDHRNDFYLVNEGPNHPVGHSSENPYAILFSFCAPGSAIHDNVIRSGTRYGGGRGIGVESCQGTAKNNIDIYNNDVDVHEGPNIRVGEKYGSFALRMRSMEGQLKYIHVFKNSFIISGDPDPATKAYGHIPEALRYSNESSGSHIIVENNLFKAYAITPGRVESHAVTFDAVINSDSTLVIRNNRFESDHIIAKFGGFNYGASDITMIADTLGRLEPSYRFSTFEVGHLANNWKCTGNVMEDLVYLNGAVDKDIHLTDGGTLDIALRRTMVVQVTGRNNLPVPGAIVTATNRYGRMVVSGVTNANGIATGLVTYYYLSRTGDDSTRFNDFSIKVGGSRDIVSASQKVAWDCPPVNVELPKTDGRQSPQGKTTLRAVYDLTAFPTDIQGRIKLTWTGPGYANRDCAAAYYIVKYSQSPLADTTWDLAESGPDPPPPFYPGALHEYFIDGLKAGQRYFFALKSFDDADNGSAISNIAETLATGITRPMPLNTIIDRRRGTVILSTITVPSNMPLIYEFALDRDREYTFPRRRVGSIIDSLVFATFDSIRPGITYAWRCRALSVSRNDSSDWSPITIFDMEQGVRSGVEMADCLYPTEGAALVNDKPTFSVKDLPDVDALFIQVADDPGFQDIIESSLIQTRDGHPTYWRMSKKLPGSGVYYWRVSSNNTTWTAPISFTANIDIHPFPNPFNASKGQNNIIFDNLPKNCTIDIISGSGAVIRKAEGVGPDDWIWDVKDDNGRDVPSGDYLFVVHFKSGSISGKMTIIR